MPPKLLTLHAPTVRNYRTLVWLQNQDTVNWSKWDPVVSSIAYYHKWSMNKIVGIILIHPEDMNRIDELFTISKKVPIILISNTILSLHDWSNFDNIINLDDLTDYPFLTPWDGTVSDAVGILALLFRYNRIMDCDINEPRLSYLQSHSITISHNSKPNRTWLFTQLFKHTNEERLLEIKECLRRNAACPHIEKIIVINEIDYTSEFDLKEFGSKVHQVVTGNRLTYSDFLMYVYYSVPKNTFTVLCNADIYFEDLSDLHKINMENRMLALLRWDVDKDGNSTIFGPRADSQDSWIFLSDSIKSKKWEFTKFNFQLGQAGCDNAFAGHILRNKFVITNPAITLKSYHLHNTNIRNYDIKDYIRSDVYINIVPTYIIDTAQDSCSDSKKYSKSYMSNEATSFTIKSSSMSNEITYCTMLGNDKRYIWEPLVENHYFESIPLYKWNNVGVTTNGLVYDLYTIYKGTDEHNYWENAEVDILTPLHKSDKMFAIPFKNTDVFKELDLYIVEYISRCARLLQQYPGTSFWLPKEFEKDVRLDTSNAVYFNNACWAKEVIGFLPGPNELGIEDIAALRSLYPWVEKPVEKTCVIVGDITESVVLNIQSIMKGWSVRFAHSYEDLYGVQLCIVMNKWATLWALPKGCILVEFQQELHITGECQHLAHVAGFTSWVLLLSKGFVEEQMIEQMEKWFNKNL